MATNLFDTVMDGASVRRLGDLTVVYFGRSGGGLLVDSVAFLSMRKWAQQKPASGNHARDLNLLLGRLECYVARHGSGIAPKGGGARLLRLAKAMHGQGMDPEDWNFPREVADELRRKPEPADGQPRRRDDAGDEADADPD